VFRPLKPIALEPNSRVWMMIEVAPPESKPTSFLQTARSLNLTGPADWSAHLEQYLYEKEDYHES